MGGYHEEPTDCVPFPLGRRHRPCGDLHTDSLDPALFSAGGLSTLRAPISEALAVDHRFLGDRRADHRDRKRHTSISTVAGLGIRLGPFPEFRLRKLLSVQPGG